MIGAIIAILLLLWFFGLLSHIGGSLIHILLVVALIVFIARLLTSRRA